jgi:phosphoribosylaminoimidazolecarboxamide formyltransferase/IMP cyclohydrolase
MKITRALISVSDKSGLDTFVRGLHALGVIILSTGGTAEFIRNLKIPVVEVADFTGYPECFDGRVKTLHPKVHGGLLYQRENPEHVAQAKEHGVLPIDLVVVNFYPFEQTVAKDDVTLEDAIENIDIGGPAMIRSAAKNYQSVTVVTHPEDYTEVLLEMETNGGETTLTTRQDLALKVFEYSQMYETAIADYLTSKGWGA